MAFAGLDEDFIMTCIDAGRKENYAVLRTYLSGPKMQKNKNILCSKPEVVNELASSFSNDELIGLIRSFVIAEKFNAEWPSNSSNPAVLLYKRLIARSPETKFIIDQWVREHHSSSYILRSRGAAAAPIVSSDFLRFTKILFMAFLVFGSVYICFIPLMTGKGRLALLSKTPDSVVATIYTVVSSILFVVLYLFFTRRKVPSAILSDETADIYDQIEKKKDEARKNGIPDLFLFLYHSHIKFYPKWQKAAEMSKICSLVTDIEQESDECIGFMLNSHKYKMFFKESHLFNPGDVASRVRGDWQLFCDDTKVLGLRMLKEGYDYDAQWQCIDITAFRAGEWIEDFRQLKTNIDSDALSAEASIGVQKTSRLKDDFGL